MKSEKVWLITGGILAIFVIYSLWGEIRSSPSRAGKSDRRDCSTPGECPTGSSGASQSRPVERSRQYPSRDSGLANTLPLGQRRSDPQQDVGRGLERQRS